MNNTASEKSHSNRVRYRHDLGNDRWIAEHLFPGLKNGFFIEAGATNGVNGSATYILEKELQWKGLCVEPIPWQNERISEFRDCFVDNRALWKESGETLEFTIFPDRTGHSGLTSTNKNISKMEFDNEAKQLVSVTTVTLEDLLEEYKAPKVIDYFCLDVEGAEADVLGAFNFDEEYCIKAWSIEGHACNEIMLNAGYERVINPYTDNSFETYWVHRSALS